MRYFYGVYPKDRGLRAFLSLIRYVCQPDAIRYAHITVRGPYSRRLPKLQVLSLNCAIDPLHRMHLGEPDSFFEGTQNTVLLRVDAERLKDVWHKPDYPDSIAHITLYDGNSRAQALRVLNVVSSYCWDMNISTSELTVIEPKISDSDGFLSMTTDLHRAYAKFRLEADLPELGSVASMDFADRLAILRSMMEVSGLKKVAHGCHERIIA